MVRQLPPYTSRVTLSLRHAALESLPHATCKRGHDQAASCCKCCSLASCSTCMLASGRRTRRGVRVFPSSVRAHRCSRRAAVDRIKENALDAFRHVAGYWCQLSKELSSFRVGLRDHMHVLSCTTALLRYMYSRYQTETIAGSTFCTGGFSCDARFSAIGSRFRNSGRIVSSRHRHLHACMWRYATWNRTVPKTTSHEIAVSICRGYTQQLGVYAALTGKLRTSYQAYLML